ncbi:MAG: hypothetical protein HYV07_22080 [Deltaproteobacteria bacterium]|nr:hypothetical protein [Deltaproteobacteria bacterium]
MRWLIGACISISLSGCAAWWQVDDLEEKVELILQATKSETMRNLFGEQSAQITDKMDELSAEERQKLDELVEAYQRGNTSVEEVRAAVLGTLGGAERVVAGAGGMWLRDDQGRKTKTVGRNVKIKECRKLSEDQIPEPIRAQKKLMQYSWGVGQIDGQTVIYPWELTMSSFAKEVVENTAKRTAQEILRMAGEKGWNKPVYIQVSTEQPNKVTVTHQGEDDIYVNEPGDKQKVGDDKAAPQ